MWDYLNTSSITCPSGANQPNYENVSAVAYWLRCPNREVIDSNLTGAELWP